MIEPQYARTNPPGIEPAGRRALVWGTALAFVVYAVPILRFVLSYLNTIVHELGHTVAGWSFGYASIPAFDWRYGGGVTLEQSRSTFGLLVLYALLAWLVFALREHPRLRNLAVVFVVLYSIAAFTSLHEIVRLAMGHTMELLIAGVFLYRALTGSAVASPAERPLYAMCGVFLLLSNLTLAWGLMTDSAARAAYGAAKGGGHWMDLSRIARDHLGVGLPAVAFLLFVGCLATPPLTYLAHRRGADLVDALVGE